MILTVVCAVVMPAAALSAGVVHTKIGFNLMQAMRLNPLKNGGIHLNPGAGPQRALRSNELLLMSERIATRQLMEKRIPDECALELKDDACPVDLVPAHCLPDLDLDSLELISDDESGEGEMRGFQSTTKLQQNKGCAWIETADTLTAELRIPGLRGQPAGCLAAHIMTSRDAARRGLGTVTISAFGRPVWGCALRGAIVPDMSSVEAEDGPQMMPVLRVSVRKLPGSKSWDGFIGDIDTDCLLQ